MLGALLAADVPNPEDPKGEPLGAVGDELTPERLNEMRHEGVKTVTVFAGYTTLDLREEEQPTTHPRPARTTCWPSTWPIRRPARSLAEAGAELTEALAQEADQGGRAQGRGAAARPARVGVAADQEHAGQGPDPQRGRGPGADLRPAPAGRRAQPRDRAAAAPEAVLQPEALRPRAGGPLQDQPAAQAQDRPEPHGPDRGRLHRDHPLPDRPARRARATPTTSTTSATGGSGRWAS